MMAGAEQSNQTTGKHLNLGRWIFLGLSSIMLTFSVFMSLFAPFPLAIGHIAYGRVKGFLLSFACMSLVFILTHTLFSEFYIFIFFVLASLTGAIIAEIVLRDIHPVKGLIRSGFTLVGIFAVLSVLFVANLDRPLQEYIESKMVSVSQEVKSKEAAYLASGDENTRMMFEILSRPEVMAKEILQSLPAAAFIGVFFWLWANLLLVLKGHRFFTLDFTKGRYTEYDLLRFRVPEKVIWLVIPTLLMATWGDRIDPSLPLVGMTFMKCIGIFYFFQGFGIYIAFLDYLRIQGFVRTFLVLFTVISGSWIIALVGLFDLWINFRKFFVKKHKGDKS